jgi:hypothetical protein
MTARYNKTFPAVRFNVFLLVANCSDATGTGKDMTFAVKLFNGFPADTNLPPE